MAKDTGGPAYPVPGTEQGHIPNGTWNQTYEPPIAGMTLLDHFAGLVMQGVLGNDCDALFSYDSPKRLAEDSYAMAEAMIVEKRRREE